MWKSRAFRASVGIAMALAGATAIASVPAQATSLGCPPDVETCQDLPYVGGEGCTGTSCDSENQFCCLV